MGGCPLVNLIDPDTYAEGMPYDELRRYRAQGPVVWHEDPRTGVPYWAVVGQQELDYVSKHPELFSSAARSPSPPNIRKTR